MRQIVWGAAVVAAAMAGAPCQAWDELTSVRLMTFNAEILTAPNVRAGSLQRYRFTPGRQAHFERVAGIIEALTPDILNLVEVTSREGVDLVVELLHEKGLEQYRGYHIDSSDTFTGMDVALISRLKPERIAGASIRHFSADENPVKWREEFTFIGREGRSVTSRTTLSRHAIYYFNVAGHRLGFLGLHLKSNPQDDYSNARRAAQAKIALRIAREEIVARDYVPIILGDLNDYDPDVPDRDVTRGPQTNVLPLLKDVDEKQTGPELFNSAKLIRRQADRYTSHWDRNENGAPDGDDVYTMLDYILLPTSLEPFVKRVFIARVVDLSTSDHFPVVVDLELPHK